MAKIKAAYNLVLLTGIPVVCMTCAVRLPCLRLEVMSEQKIQLMFMYMEKIYNELKDCDDNDCGFP